MLFLSVLAFFLCTCVSSLLWQAAIRDDNPVVVLENELMYGQTFTVGPEVLDKDFVLPFGKAKIEREGTDVTIVTFSKMVGRSLEAAEKLAEKGISAEVLNLRSIRPLDRTAIHDSVVKTSRVVTVEEGWPHFGVGAEIQATLADTGAFDYLDAPPERVTGVDVPLPYAIDLEQAALPQVHNIVSACERACYRSK